MINYGQDPVDMFAEMLKRAGEINHRTVWMSGDADVQQEETKMFCFFTVCQETAERAQTILDNAGVLCHTDLGTYVPARGKNGMA